MGCTMLFSSIQIWIQTGILFMQLTNRLRYSTVSIVTIIMIGLIGINLKASELTDGDEGLPFSILENFKHDKNLPMLECDARPWNHLEVLGEEAGIWGTAGGTLEAWGYPYKMFDGLMLEFSTDSGKTYQAAAQLLRHQLAAPHFSRLRYIDDRYKIDNTLFVPRHLPGGAILLEIDTSVDLVLALRFRISLVPMLMEADKKPIVHWEEDKHQLTAFDSRRQVKFGIWSPVFVKHSTGDDGTECMMLDIPVETARKDIIPICFAVSWPGGQPVDESIARLATEMRLLSREALNHYRKILDQAPTVLTPDQMVNDALRWSVVSLDQLRVRNPYLGYGLVSGYSTSGRGTRPKFAWFFDEPTLTSWAFHRAGLSSHVKEALEFLFRYQRDDGKVVHEVSQSLPFYPDYFKKYRYAYIHTDSAVYFLAACGHYYRSTGDIDFIRKHWIEILKVFEWCKKSVDPADDLIGIDPKDWGSAESSFGVGKDTQLAGMWVRALRDLEYLALAMNDSMFAEKCRAMSQSTSIALEKRLWDEERSTYLWGIDREGKPLRSMVPHHAISIWMGSLRPDRAVKNLQRMASADFRSDWGVRSLALTDENYNPRSYQTGTVWPVWNTGVIIGDYMNGRQIDAFSNFMSMARLRTLDGLGPMPEVLHGRYYKRLTNGVPHQMFSEIAVQNGFYDGLLALEIDVPAGEITLAPRMPALWNTLTVKNIPMGDDYIEANIVKSKSNYKLTVNVESGKEYTIVLRPLLGAGSMVENVFLNDRKINIEEQVTHSGVYIKANLPNCRGKQTLRIEHKGGYNFQPEYIPVEAGGMSRNLRLVESVFHNKTWNLKVEGIPGMVYPLHFTTGENPVSIEGGRLLKSARHTVIVGLQSPSEAEPVVEGYVRWNAVIRWQ